MLPTMILPMVREWTDNVFYVDWSGLDQVGPERRTFWVEFSRFLAIFGHFWTKIFSQFENGAFWEENFPNNFFKYFLSLDI